MPRRKARSRTIVSLFSSAGANGKVLTGRPPPLSGSDAGAAILRTM